MNPYPHGSYKLPLSGDPVDAVTPLLETETQAWLRDVQCNMIKKLTSEIHAQREEILRAFIAKYGCGPDEIEQVQQNSLTEMKWFVRKRVTDVQLLFYPKTYLADTPSVLPPDATPAQVAENILNYCKKLENKP